MPVIGPSERVEAVLYLLADGLSPTIGWQFRPRAKGGPAFVIIRRTGLGSLKVIESFPLTQDGWASAWRSLITRNPAAAPRVLEALIARETDPVRLRSLEAEVARLSPHGSGESSGPYSRPLVTMHDVAYLGGYVPGAAISAGQRYLVPFLEDRLLVVVSGGTEVLADVPYGKVEDVEIGGPGIVKAGGGFVGGGFGATGAIEGMAIGAVLNGLTSRTSIKTIVRIQGRTSELFFLHTRVTPEELRIALSPALGAIRSAQTMDAAGGIQPGMPARPASPVEELAKLADMLEKAC
jgi:hypothetical protein